MSPRPRREREDAARAAQPQAAGRLRWEEHPVAALEGADPPAGVEAASPDLLDILPLALAIVDAELKLLRANDQALDLLGGSFQPQSLLRLLARADQAAEARRALGEAVAVGERALLLLNWRERPPLLLRACPVGNRSSLIALAPLGGGSPDTVAQLKRLYGLSDAEARVAVAAACGMDMVEIAHSRGVTVNTLRAQIAAVKAKMDLTRIAEVAAIVSRLDAMVSWF